MMRTSSGLHAFIPLVLTAAVLAGCDGRTPDLPTDARVAVGGADMAPLLSAGASAIPGRYVVVMHPGDGEAPAADAVASEIVQEFGGRVHHTYSANIHGFAATLPPRAVEALRRNPRVKYVEEDAMTYPSQVTQPGATWGLDRVDQRLLPLNGSYTYDRTGTGVRVYVIDSGIRTSHSQFGGRASVGIDFVGDGQNGQDCNGHGTHVSGTIGSTTYGVAKQVQLIAVRVFPCSGGTATSTVIAAEDWVRLNHVKPAVANYSGGGAVSTAHNEAVKALVAAGVVFVTAAGNDGFDACNRSPASAPEAITVGSTQSDDARSSFSNWGTCVDLFAPGSSITSTWWNSDTAIGTISGTSMASPHVAGVAALYLQGAPAATPATVTTQVLANTTPDRVTLAGAGSPNRLLYSLFTAPPAGPFIQLNRAALDFTFVRGFDAAPGDAAQEAGARPAFTASGGGEAHSEPAGVDAIYQATATSQVLTGRVLLSNAGMAPLNWSAAGTLPWVTANPGDGVLNPGQTTPLDATVNAAGIPGPGQWVGAVAITGAGAANSPVNLNVSVRVVDGLPLAPGTPRTGLAGGTGSLTYYAVTVPAGATSLSIATSGGTGDVDLYVRYANAPSPNDWDCRPFMGGNVENCVASYPPAGLYFVMLHGWSSYTGVTLSATVGGTPAAPVNVVSAAFSTTSLRTTWTDASVNEASFSVERRSRADSVWSAWAAAGGSGPNAVRFTENGLTPGGTYQHRLRTCNPAGCSAWVMGQPVTLPTAVPGTPLGLMATVTSATSAGLTWTDESTEETSLTLTRALRNPDGTWGAYAALATLPANAVSYNSTGLLAGRAYRYQLRACNAVGCSAWATSNIVVMPTPPGVPQSISGTAISGNSIRVTFTDGSSAETSFELARAPVVGGVVGAFAPVATLPAAAGAYTPVVYNNTGVAAGTYRYRVAACNVAGCSAWVTSGNVTIPPVPAAPTGLAGTALSSTSIRLNWTDAAAVETSYQVFRALRNLDGTWPAYASAATLAANAVTWDNASLLSGREYRYQVRACNVSGCSAWATSPIVATP